MRRYSLAISCVHQVVLFIDSIVVFPTLSDNPSQLFLMRCSANGPDVISAKAKKLKLSSMLVMQELPTAEL